MSRLEKDRFNALLHAVVVRIENDWLSRISSFCTPALFLPSPSLVNVNDTDLSVGVQLVGGDV